MKTRRFNLIPVLLGAAIVGILELAAMAADSRAGRSAWWSLQPVRSPRLPAVKRSDWPRNPIDRFILAKLEANGLSPSPPADRRTLIRRVTFDLTGLPPTPEEIENYLSDKSDRSYEKLVDRLLASPHYGERWARHWMDVIRFAESQGFERNKLRPSAWKYRDWVVEALNSDLPYDEFVRMQVAGDVLRPDDPLAVIAAGLLVLGPYDLTAYTDGTQMMRAAAREEELEGLVGTVSQTFLGLTVNCARCHDHKFDPITQREYYQIASALGGTYHGDERESLSESGRAAAQRQREALARQLEPLRSRLAALEAPARKALASPSPRSQSGEKRVSTGLQALYTFDGASPRTLKSVGASGPSLELSESDSASVARDPAGFSIKAAALFTSAEPPAPIVQACESTNEITLEAWITPADSSQTGPARILSLSSGTGERNFTLAQAADKFDVRLRTTATDANGIPSLASRDGSAVPRATHVVYVREAAGTARFYINGKPDTEGKVEGDFSNWSDDYKLVLANETTRDRPWRGILHLAAIYNRALTAQEVAANFGADRERFQPISTDIDRRILAVLKPEARIERQRLAAEITRLENRVTLLAGGPAHLSVPKDPGVFHVLLRGDFRHKGDPVTPSGLASLTGLSPDWKVKPDAPEAERRKALAAWLTDKRNPLTARVIVNRLWTHHFSAGLAPSPSDFGLNGGRPSHPELLDWLANELMSPTTDDRRLTTNVENQKSKIENTKPWTLKRIHRIMVTSAAYRQASRPRKDALAKDADNRLLWRMSPRRLEAEALRDAVLSVSGELNPRVGGPGFRDWTVKSQGNNEIYTVYDAVGPEFNRRTIYRTVVRAGTSHLLDTLDCPDPSVSAPRRSATTTPLQAFALLNNPFMERSAASMADRLRRERSGSVRAQIERAYRLAFGRPAAPSEIQLALPFTQEHGLGQFCLVLFNANEFLFVD